MEPVSNSGLNRIELMILKDRDKKDVVDTLALADLWANGYGQEY